MTVPSFTVANSSCFSPHLLTTLRLLPSSAQHSLSLVSLPSNLILSSYRSLRIFFIKPITVHRAQLAYCDMHLMVLVALEPGQPKWKVVEWNHVPWSVRRCGSGQERANGLAKQT